MKPNFIFQLLLTLAAFALVLVSGCGSKPNITKDDAAEVAKAEVLRRGWKEVEIEDVRFDEGRWSITIWRLPKVPGGHGTVEVSTNGKVLRFIPGM